MNIIAMLSQMNCYLSICYASPSLDFKDAIRPLPIHCTLSIECDVRQLLKGATNACRVVVLPTISFSNLYISRQIPSSPLTAIGLIQVQQRQQN